MFRNYFISLHTLLAFVCWVLSLGICTRAESVSSIPFIIISARPFYLHSRRAYSIFNLGVSILLSFSFALGLYVVLVVLIPGCSVLMQLGGIAGNGLNRKLFINKFPH